MAVHLTENREGFPRGLTEITRLGEPADDTGIAFSVLKLAAGERWTTTPKGETALLLMDGRARLTAAGESHGFARGSLFDESPSALHVAAGEPIEVLAESECEFTLYA